MSSMLGTTLGGRYTLESRIGSGGMSTVYRAHDETLERFVAIKVMNREVATDSDQLERFRREARAVARLSHPNIVHVIDAGEDDGRPFIVFEYIEGETLKDRIRRLGRLEIPEAVAYCIEIARALGAAHASNIVHRDVKPQNVLLDHEGTAKVTDFGIARTLEEDGLTDDGRVLGTTDYVSPEQALGQPVTGQSDLYSLGIALYEMLTGQLPFSAETQVAVAMKHVREDIPDVRKLRPDVSAMLASVVEGATAKERSERYADDAELIADLESVLALETTRAGSADGEVTSVLKTLPPETRRRVPVSIRRRGRALAALLTAAAVVAAVLVALALRTHHNNGPAGKHGSIPGSPVPVALSAAFAYNPDSTSGGTFQENGEAKHVIDRSASTSWSTQQYDGGQLNKKGVGVFVRPGNATTAVKMVVDTATSGFAATIYATASQPDPNSFTASNWVPVGRANDVSQRQRFPLRTDGKRYRFYLVWITALPPGGDYASVNEIQLYR
jgi:serine/threonine-protein kinase